MIVRFTRPVRFILSFCAIAVAILLLATRPVQADPQAPPPSEPPASAAKLLPKLGTCTSSVLIVPIHDEIDLGLAPFVQSALTAADRPCLVILDVNTFGGRIDAAVRIRDAILHATVPTLAYVNPRAISAGALISLAADYIVVAEGATMGAATPIELSNGEAKSVGEKMTSYMRSEMRSTAEAKGRNGDLAAAMVDAELDIPGLAPKGQLLTLTTDSAISSHIADARVATLPELLQLLELEGKPQIRPAPSLAHQLARFVTSPVVAGLLMSLGFLAMMLEFKAPGFGLAGTISIVCFGLFFGGHMIANLAGWEELVLAAVGVAAIAIEIFITPGFGAAGVIGVTLLGTSLVLAMLDSNLRETWTTGMLGSSIGAVLLSLLGSVVLFALVAWWLHRTGRSAQLSGKGWLILGTTLKHANATGTSEQDAASLIGRSGRTLTDLRPAGKAEFEDQVLDVVSGLGYIEKGTNVLIIDVEGARIVVRPQIKRN